MAPNFQVVESSKSQVLPQEKRVVVLGNIDGFHRGHQQLVRRALELGGSGKTSVWLATFDPHPLEVLKPGSGFKRIFSRYQQQEILSKSGLDGVFYFHFSQALAALSPREFLQNHLLKHLNPKAVVVGFNFRFGQGRSGGAEELADWGHQHGVEIHTIPAFSVNGQVVSSTHVRKFLQLGQVDFASELLGFRFFLEGPVEPGAGRGHQLGFPTANIKTPQTLIPAFGVYATELHFEGQRLPAISHLGPLPSFDDSEARLETHVLDGNWDLRAKKIRVEFVQRVREVQKFDSIQALKTQISTDIQTARGIHGQS